MKKTKEDFNLLTRIALKILHKIQKFAISNDMKSLYDTAFRLHFKLWFGKDLVKEMLLLSEEGNMALRRHGRIVVKNVYPNQTKRSKKFLYRSAMTAYRDNLVLEQEP